MTKLFVYSSLADYYAREGGRLAALFSIPSPVPTSAATAVVPWFFLKSPSRHLSAAKVRIWIY